MKTKKEELQAELTRLNALRKQVRDKLKALPIIKVGTRFIYNDIKDLSVFEVYKIEDDNIYVEKVGENIITIFSRYDVILGFDNGSFIELNEEPSTEHDMTILNMIYLIVFDKYRPKNNKSVMLKILYLLKRMNSIIEKGAN